MPTETKFMLAWVAAAFGFIALIVALWIVNAGRIQNNGVSYGAPTDTGTLESPHTPLIVAENRQATTVSSIAENLPDATQFASLLQSTGVDKLIASGQPYTVFVPTDRAMHRLPPGMLSGMSAAQLKRLIEYHVVAGRAIDVNAVDSGQITALSKDALNFSINPGDQSARVNSSVVLEAYRGKNGVVYLVDNVLLPPVRAFTPGQ
jgi:uncharacterized surface protein with fasciclin (FAS1) repeats